MIDLDESSTRVRQITWVGIWVNLVLSIAKIFAGIVGNSKALIADGIESGADIVTSLALVVGSKFWSAPPDKDHPYGHRRIETIMTLGIGVVVGVVGLSIIWNALSSIRMGIHSHPTILALVVAVVSVLSKEWLFQWSAREGRKIQSMSVIANAWHHRSDAISSIPVVLSVGAAQFFPEWSFLDAIGAIIAGGFILKASFDIAWPALRQMIDTGAAQSTVAKLESIATSVQGVRSVHSLRTRYLGSSIGVDLHIVVDPEITVVQGHEIGDEVEAQMKAQLPEVCEVLIHLDPFEDQ
ncbi:MAG: cation transporter [Fibrobacterota bacterium]|nr:cation transporter [Fibrobacterota bacterium]QQS04978.1 MAG: cation transporter [Fibrobacterota bacterium]